MSEEPRDAGSRPGHPSSGRRGSGCRRHHARWGGPASEAGEGARERSCDGAPLPCHDPPGPEPVGARQGRDARGLAKQPAAHTRPEEVLAPCDRALRGVQAREPASRGPSTQARAETAAGNGGGRGQEGRRIEEGAPDRRGCHRRRWRHSDRGRRGDRGSDGFRHHLLRMPRMHLRIAAWTWATWSRRPGRSGRSTRAGWQRTSRRRSSSSARRRTRG